MFPGPSINESGVAAFMATLDAGGRGIYSGSGGDLSTIALTGGAFATFAHQPTINNDGKVAFQAELDPGEDSVYRSDGSAYVPILSSPLPYFYTYSYPTINASGAVGFHTYEATGYHFLMAGDGGAPAANIYTHASPTFSGFLGAPDLNDTPEMAFIAGLDSGGFGIYRGSGGPFATIAVSADEWMLFHAIALNNAGDIAFWATKDDGSSGIYLGDGSGGVSTIAASGALYYSFGPVALNDVGDVAFNAYSAPGIVGIFNGPDPATDKIIASGDALFGSTVSTVSSFRGLNNSGQLAFFYQLASGVLGVAIATPLVPCPADITGDGSVDVDDLLAVLGAWGAVGAGLPADVTADGAVDIDDLLAVIGAWGAC
jgi:hypothetical protein